ncbi:MAG: AsmA-like C-terminal region-containing protein [Thermoguttaceae bacterium]|nr:AsmA-like C-terminal region-containing protein [Thermoguttaceae bacterium]MDW8039478.1 AsmA-like C-terminal region-containing protein [Thermoguttaceae bacterium]
MAVVGVAIGVGYFYRQVDQKLRSEVLRVFAKQYPHLKISLRSAELVREAQREGILLRGLQLAEPVGGDWLPLLECEELFLNCPTNWSDLLQGNIPIHRLQFYRPTLYLRRSPEGTWNYSNLQPQASLSDQHPELGVEQGTVILVLDTSKPTSHIIFRDVRMVLGAPGLDSGLQGEGERPSDVPSSDVPGRAQQLRLSLTGQSLQELTMEGWLDLASGDYALWAKVVGWELTPDWQALLPNQQIPQWLSGRSFQGQVDASFRLVHRASLQELIQWELAGRLTNGRLQDPRLPYPLTDIWAVFRADPDGLRVEQLFARHGAATLRLSYRQNGYQLNCPFHLEAEIRHLELRREWLELVGIRPSLVRHWDLYRPSGQANLDVVLDYDGQHWFPEVTVECLDVSFLYAKFPYRLDHAQGRLELRNDTLWLQLTAFSENQPVRITGEILHPLNQPTGWVEIQAQGLPIDQKFFDALQEPTRRFLAPLHPQGSLDVAYRWHRERLDQQGSRQIRLQLQRGAICYDRFPYPIRNLRGTFECTDGRWELWGLTGSNGSAQIRGYGHLIPIATPSSQPLAQTPENNPENHFSQLLAGRLFSQPLVCTESAGLFPSMFRPAEQLLPPMELYLNLVAEKVPLDEELREALPPAAQRLWNQLRPTGQVDLSALEIRYRTGQPAAEVRFTAQPIPDRSSIEPVAFPYRLEKLQGKLFFAHNQVFWQGFRGEHGSVRIGAELFGRLQPDGAWQLEMENLFVDRLPLDRELTKALPEPLKKAFAVLNPEGSLALRGRWQLAQSAEPASRLSCQWNLELTMIGGRLQPGILLENIHGAMQLAGHWHAQDYALWGQMDLDSFLYQGCQFVRVRGPFWIDSQYVLFGPDAQTRQQTHLAEQTGKPADSVAGAAARLITGELFGGQATGQGWIRLGSQPEFALRATLSEANLAQIAQEHLPGIQDLQGKLSGWLYLHGYGKNIHTFTGRGALHLREADIYELPLMIALLKVLNLRRPDTNAFSDCDLQFRIAGPHIYLDRIAFQGDAISLHGAGETNFHGDLNLTLSPILGREDRKPPLLKQLLGGAGQEFMVIRVTGSLHEPKTEKQVFPTLNQAVQNLTGSQIGPGAAASGTRLANPLHRLPPKPLGRPWSSIGQPPLPSQGQLSQPP